MVASAQIHSPNFGPKQSKAIYQITLSCSDNQALVTFALYSVDRIPNRSKKALSHSPQERLGRRADEIKGRRRGPSLSGAAKADDVTVYRALALVDPLEATCLSDDNFAVKK